MQQAELIELSRRRIDDFKRFQKEGLINLKGEFFPSVHYPPITMYSDMSEEELFKGYSNPSDGLFDIYVHFPFCKQICTFCHFVVTAGATSESKDHYIEMVEKEIELYTKKLNVTMIKARSVLIGGGTPTYMTPRQLERFLKIFTSKFDMSLCTQFNYDVEPTTLIGSEGRERLQILKRYGVNRLTVGVQSFDDNILRDMHRPHTSRQALESIEQSKAESFQLDIEFIYGYPGQTIESWQKTIETAIATDVDEIQLYRLKIIPYGDGRGRIFQQYQKNLTAFFDAEQSIVMKENACLALNESGYRENLRRVFTKKRTDFSHYAENVFCNLYDQIGLGLKAFSSYRDRFVLGDKKLENYYTLINRGRLPVNRGLVRSHDDQKRWCFVQPLKCREINKRAYQRQTGVSLNSVFRNKIEKLKKWGLLYEDDNVLKLTALGSFFADEVCQQFYHPNYIPFPKSLYADGELNPYYDQE